jgi:hypothetical protein
MMTKMKSISGLAVLLSVLIMMSQCTTVHKETVSPIPDLKTEKIPDEIERLEEIADKHADPSIRAKAYLHLAKLYSSYKNTKPNYQQALKKLEMYLSFEPAKGETDEMQNWLALLRELVKEHDEIRKAKQTINQLAKENKELKDAVEELKNIDIQMEEKRKQVK